MCWPSLRQRKTSFCLVTLSNWSNPSRAAIPMVLLSLHSNICSAGRRRSPPTRACSWKRRGACTRSSAISLRRCSTEERLHPCEGLGHQKVEGHPGLGESGLWFVSVHHEGSRNASAEEVECIADLMDGLLQSGVNWIDDKGRSRPLQLNDVLIVAPYNAQVSDLSNRLPNARIGTVDKFQGQQAPVVIYSMKTSSPEDAPRGMEFLYSLNRLNVATVACSGSSGCGRSPRLLEPECRSPRQMQLANAPVCRNGSSCRDAIIHAKRLIKSPTV